MRRWFALNVIRPVITLELPGWGRIYRFFIGSYENDPDWRDEMPRIVRDKRHGLCRIVDLGHWADRSLFFLRRWYELDTELVIAAFLHSGDRVCDVGANYGHFTLAAAATVGPSGAVFSFEPNPRAFSRLSLHVELNRLANVTVRNIGIADVEGELTLHVPRVNSGEATFGETLYEDAESVTCPVHRLDDIDAIGAVDFLKIDVEGFEAHVLRGALRTLETHRPYVFTEVVRRHLGNAGETPESLAELLGGLGYLPFRIALARAGLGQRLRLVPVKDLTENGDYLWLPTEKQAEAGPFL